MIQCNVMLDDDSLYSADTGWRPHGNLQDMAQWA